MPRGKKKAAKRGRPRKVREPVEQPSTGGRTTTFDCHKCGESMPMEKVLCFQRIVEGTGKKEKVTEGALCRKCGGYE